MNALNLAHRILALVVILLLCTQSVRAADAPAQHIYAVEVNGQQVTTGAVILETAAGALLVAEDDLIAWGFSLKGLAPTLVVAGAPYYALSDFPGLTTKLTVATQTLAIQAPPGAFAERDIALKTLKNGRPVFDGTRGLYLNYDLDEQRSFERANTSVFSTLSYTGLPGGGVINNTITFNAGTGSTPSYSRVGTTYELDDLEKLTSLRLGDAASSPGTLGSSVPFAGIQRQTNFDLDPNLVTIPTFSANGVALSQGTVDVFVNGVETARQNVGSGPFTISNLPTIDGQGDVTLVVRDIYGREHVVVQPFYYSRRLLKVGLTSSSYEAGFVRRDFGTGYGSYGGGVLSGTLRRGITNQLTGEAHVEVDGLARLAEIGADFLANRIGVFHTAIAESSSAGKLGTRAMLAYDFTNRGGFSAFASADAQSAAFASVGRAAFGQELTLTGGVRVRASKHGFLSTAVVSRHIESLPSSVSFATGYSQPLAGGTVSLSLTKSFTNGATGVAFYYIGNPEGRRSIVAQGSAGAGGSTDRIVLNESLPTEGFGTGYAVGITRAQAGHNAIDATVIEHSDYGDAIVNAIQGSGGQGTAYQALVRGAISLLGGRVHATRPVTSSYGLVRIPGFPNVRVYLGAQLVGKTDGHGDLFLPDLAPYVNNYITLDARDVPLSVNVDSLTAKIVPYARNAAIVRFHFKRDGGVVIRAVDRAGVPLPFGTSLTGMTAKLDETWAVAQDGVAYLKGAKPGPLLLVASTDHRICQMTLTIPEDTATIPNIGSQVCASSTTDGRVAVAASPVPKPLPNPMPASLVGPSVGVSEGTHADGATLSRDQLKEFRSANPPEVGPQR